MAGKTGGYREADRRLLERELDRARFLRLIGAGATLPFIPTSLTAFGARPSSAQTIGPEILSKEGEYPIGVWSPPPPSQTNQQRYQEIADANFNFVVGGNGATGNDDHPRTLAAAEAAGLRFLLTDNILQNAVNGEVSRDRQDAVTKRLVRLLEDHGTHLALAGLNLYDEPNSRLFDILAYAKRELQRLAPQELAYINIWPSYAAPRALGARTYGKYLNHYFGTVNPPLLSFDHYPLLSKGITSDYFYNWVVIRNFSRRFGVPSWGFIQSVGFDGGFGLRRTPDRNEIFWQINVSLAYGAKGIQYFTYWTPSDPGTRFGNALITRDGQRTVRYRYAAQANGYLKKIGKKLLPLRSESVVHARERRSPRGAQVFRADKYVRSVGGDPAILSRFSKPGVGTERYLLVVNRSPANPSNNQLAMTDTVRRVYEFDVVTGEFDTDPIALEGRILRVGLGPGRAKLYRLETG